MNVRLRAVGAWGPFGVVCAVVVVRAATAPAAEASRPASDVEKHAAFDAIAGQERAMRHAAANNFPTDHWSQDDDFHNMELQHAKDFARDQRVRLDDVLEAVDEGMRERWSPAAAAMTATVSPCRPRLIY